MVPPTLTTSGETAGHSAPAAPPSSPEAAMNVTFGLAKYAAVSYAVSPLNSLPPQLIETTFACFAAVCTAVIRSLVLAELASTRTIFAPGAAAWAHSTSSAISSDQPASVWGSLVVWPDWFSTVRFAAGRLYSLSNVARSAAMFGSL